MTIAPRNPELDLSLLHLLHRAGQCTDELFEQNSGRKITARQFAVLLAVSQIEEGSQTDIGKLTGIDRSTAADIVIRLTERGWLQRRRRIEEDARAYAVTLTPAGEAALKVGLAALRKTDEAILAALSPARRERFLEALGKLVASLGAD